MRGKIEKPRNGSADLLYMSEDFIRGLVSRCVCNVLKFHTNPAIGSHNTSLYWEASAICTNIGWKSKIYTVMDSTCQTFSWLP
jgi:hypothetical protein